MARLKRDLLQMTGNVYFCKTGNAYTVFHVDKDKQLETDASDVNQEPVPTKENSA